MLLALSATSGGEMRTPAVKHCVKNGEPLSPKRMETTGGRLRMPMLRAPLLPKMAKYPARNLTVKEPLNLFGRSLTRAPFVRPNRVYQNSRWPSKGQTLHHRPGWMWRTDWSTLKPWCRRWSLNLLKMRISRPRNRPVHPTITLEWTSGSIGIKILFLFALENS